jgi:hypothetical protein
MHKEQVLNYLSSIKWNSGDWNWKTIEENINSILSKKCTIDIKYKKDVIINELNHDEAHEIKAVEKVCVKYISGFNEKNLPIVEEIEILL